MAYVLVILRGDIFWGDAIQMDEEGYKGKVRREIKPERMQKLVRDEERTLLKIKDNVETYSFVAGHSYRIWRRTSYIALGK